MVRMRLEGTDSRKKGEEDSADPMGMREKYFHSLGAMLSDEGRFDEAVVALNKALVLDDAPYTHYQLSMAFLGKKEIGNALRELDRAIEIAPMTPEYYYERSLIRLSAGDPGGASVDLAKAIEIDGDYGRIDEIKSAIEGVRQAFDDPETEDRLRRAAIKDPRLRTMVDDLTASMRADYEAQASSSCPVGTCPAYCCHFTGPMVRHGVVIGAWKLRCIKDLLREKSLLSEDFVDRLPDHGEGYLRELILPPYFIKEGAGHFIFFPKRAADPVDAAILRDLPKGQDFQTLMWINEQARPCSFLSGGRCIIHDAGEEAGLPACKQFLCLTGFVFVILGHLGVAGTALIEGRTMTQLNRIALEALLILFREIYGHTGLMETGRARKDALRAAINADRSGDEPSLAAGIEEYSRISAKYEELFSFRKESARREIEDLISRV
jgi:hypothetical protein